MSNEPNDMPAIDLCNDDRQILDALIEVDFDAERLEPLSELDRRRARQLVSMFSLLEDYPVEDADPSLLDATMARIDQHERQSEERLRFDVQQENLESAASTGRRLFRIPDFITVAAMLLIVAGIGFPLMNNVKRGAIDSGCANNMRLVGRAFDQYATDYNGRLPVAQAGLFSGWDAGAHNSINLEPLLANGYCDNGHLNCPGHGGEEGTSYSYQWQSSDQPMNWATQQKILVLGDRNPVIDARRDGQFAPPLTISLNHGGRGQNVLTSDNSVLWLVKPVIDQDDEIWLPRGAKELEKGVRPAGPDDTFLAH